MAGNRVAALMPRVSYRRADVTIHRPLLDASVPLGAFSRSRETTDVPRVACGVRLTLVITWSPHVIHHFKNA